MRFPGPTAGYGDNLRYTGLNLKRAGECQFYFPQKAIYSVLQSSSFFFYFYFSLHGISVNMLRDAT